MGQYFKQLCQWLDLEAGSELYTVAELATCQDGGIFW